MNLNSLIGLIIFHLPLHPSSALLCPLFFCGLSCLLPFCWIWQMEALAGDQSSGERQAGVFLLFLRRCVPSTPRPPPQACLLLSLLLSFRNTVCSFGKGGSMSNHLPLSLVLCAPYLSLVPPSLHTLLPRTQLRMPSILRWKPGW